MRHRNIWLVVLLTLAIAFSVCVAFRRAVSSERLGATQVTGTQTSPVFTPAHRTTWEAVRDFFGWRTKPVQPIAFTHKTHLAQGLQCVGCHSGVDEGPDAQIPGAKVCMVCHDEIAADKPEIQKVKAYVERGEDIRWQRVYAYSAAAHVKFNHAPHIRAGVACATCHGDMTKQTTAVRAIDLTMGYCVDCHRAKQASTDCLTCHY